MTLYVKLLRLLILSLILGNSLLGYEGSLREKLLQKKIEQMSMNKEKSVQNSNEEVISTFEIAYLDDGHPMHRLDIYAPNTKKRELPVLVHIHGGGWRTGDKKNMKEIGEFYASKGVIFITPNYRLTPEVKHPEHVNDCAAALSWVFKRAKSLGADTTRIYLSGHSAGAHLATLLGTNKSYLEKYGLKPSDLAGVISVDTASFDLTSSNQERLVKRLIRQAFGQDMRTLSKASPFQHINEGKSYPRFLVLNTTERATALKEAQKFISRLHSIGASVSFFPIDGHTHKQMAQGMYEEHNPISKAILYFISR